MEQEVELDDLSIQAVPQETSNLPSGSSKLPLQEPSPAVTTTQGPLPPIPEEELPSTTTTTSASKLPKHLFLTNHISHTETRDHAALERTFLAYLRTASHFAHFGVSVAQLFRLNTSSDRVDLSPLQLRIGKGLGATSVVIAIAILLLGFWEFGRCQAGLIRGVAIARAEGMVVACGLGFGLLVCVCGVLAGLKAE